MFSHVHKNETSGLIEFNCTVYFVDKIDEQLSQGSEHHGTVYSWTKNSEDKVVVLACCH